MSNKKKPLIELPVIYGTVSMGDKMGRLTITVRRGELTVAQADEYLCGRRLHGLILARPEGAGATQGGLPGMDGDVEIEAFFEVTKLAITAKAITTSLHFLLAAVDMAKLSHFAKREGMLTINTVENLPENAEGHDAD